MADSFDLESLVHLEQTFFDSGHEEGYAHGRIHGLIEGRSLGNEKGFEMWEEIGFYEGFSIIWRSILEQQNRFDDRSMHHVQHLLDLVSQFPRVNPKVVSDAVETDVDIPKLFRQIRSRYKALCASLGVRPSIRASDAQLEEDDVRTRDGGLAVRSRRQPLWQVEEDKKVSQSRLDF